jgi:hypothetical protein
MGNQISSQSENKKIEQTIDKQSESINIVKDSFSSYIGLKTDLSDQPYKDTKDTTSEGSMTITIKSEAYPTKSEELKVPTAFEWREGGKLVFTNRFLF